MPSSCTWEANVIGIENSRVRKSSRGLQPYCRPIAYLQVRLREAPKKNSTIADYKPSNYKRINFRWPPRALCRTSNMPICIKEWNTTRVFPARRTKLFRFRSYRGRKIWSEGDWKLWIIQWDDSVLININWFSFFSRARCFIWHFLGELRGFSIHEINERKTSLITFQKLVEIIRKLALNIEDIY